MSREPAAQGPPAGRLLAAEPRETNDGYDYVGRVRHARPGETLIAYLARRYTHSSRELWAGRIGEGRVTLDGKVCTPATVLRDGQRLAWRRPPWREPDVPLRCEILHEDPHLLAVAKPAGLPTMPGGGFLERTLLALVRGAHPEASPMHRLGRWTSGLVLFARDPRTAAALAKAFRKGRIEKRYRALAEGRPASDAFEIAFPIGLVPHPLLGSVHAASPVGKPASSRVEVLERREEAFLAEVRIATGRPHQIRIHLAAAGHPLRGDPLYAAGGRPAPGCTALPGDPGYLLHARSLRFRHPATGSPCELRCEPPEALGQAGD